ASGQHVEPDGQRTVAAFRINQARLLDARNLYADHIQLASQAVREGQISHARDLLTLALPKPGSPDLRGFEWRYLWRAAEQNEVVWTLQGLRGSLQFVVSLVRLVSVGTS